MAILGRKSGAERGVPHFSARMRNLNEECNPVDIRKLPICNPELWTWADRPSLRPAHLRTGRDYFPFC